MERSFEKNYGNSEVFNQLITHKFKLSDCNKAFDFMMDKTNFSIKGMFVND